MRALVHCRVGARRSGFLERSDDRRLLLHDWWDYAGKWVVLAACELFQFAHVAAGRATTTRPTADEWAISEALPRGMRALADQVIAFYRKRA